MSLLGGFSGSESESGSEKSVALNSFAIYKTSDVQELLKEISSKTNLPTQKIDFDLVMIKTEIKLPNANQFTDIDKGILKRLKEEDLLLDEKTIISQTYELNLKHAVKNKDLDLIMKVSANKTYSLAKAHIKKESIIHYSPNLEKILIKELNKRKIRSGIIINLFDDEMIEGVKKLVTKIRINDGLFDDYELVLCRWPEPIPSVNDRIVKKHEEKIKEEKVNYADRGFITTIEEGEVALEYIKPKMGKPGRNFKGAFVPALEPKKTNEPKFVVDVQTIEKKDEPEKIIYIAKTKGYVKVDDKELRIADKLEITEATFRSTGNIDARLDKDIKINLKSKEKHEDNVGPNTKISASEIIVEGSVANGAELTAEKIEIKGQTHKTSKIYADSAKIGL
ncbi:MAG: hypothetical protein QG567_1762, partial [Campylobacterota bacterium]|nr:hypothetical protein [Campylobacterota bacterium]